MLYAVSIDGQTIGNLHTFEESVSYKSQFVDVPSAHGGIAPRQKRGPISWRLIGEAAKTDLTTLRDYIDDLRKTFTQNKDVNVIRLDDNRYLASKVQSFRPLVDAARAPALQAAFEIAGTAHDPFWYAASESTDQQSGSQANGKTWGVTNNGKEPTPLKIKITPTAANLTDVRITNTTTGETVRYKGTIPQNKSVIFDPRVKHHLLVGGLNDLSNMEGFFYDLAVGSNTLKYIGTTFTGTIDTFWTERF